MNQHLKFNYKTKFRKCKYSESFAISHVKLHASSFVFKKHALALGLGTFLALLLGLVSALLAACIGPTLQLLFLSEPKDFLSFNELFGRQMGQFIQSFFEVDQLRREQVIYALPIAICIFASFKAVLNVTHWYLWERVSEKFARYKRMQLIEHFFQLNPIALSQKTSIDDQLSTAVTQDIRIVREYIVKWFGGIPREGAQVVFLAFSLFWISKELFLLLLLGAGPLLISFRHLARHLKKRSKRALDHFGVMSEWLQQRFDALELIKQTRSESSEQKTMQIQNTRLASSFIRAAQLKAASGPLVELAAGLGLTIVFYFALQWIQNQTLTSAAFLSFIATASILSQSAGKLSKYFNKQRESAAAQSRLELFDQWISKNISPHQDQLLAKHSIQQSGFWLKNINFNYPKKTQKIFSEFSYTFEFGKLYGVAGASGAGKSTLMQLLLGVLKPCSGEINYKLPDKFQKNDQIIGFLPQKARLLPATLAENVAYPHSEFDSSSVRSALDTVQMLEFAEELPEGIETFVGSDARKLSGGQEQRIHLARLIYHKYPIVMIDEGTSALDAENEAYVLKFFRELAQQGKLVIMIAHRKSCLKVCDVILKL